MTELRRPSGIIVPSGAADPPSLPAARPAPPIFDASPERNVGKIAAPELAPGLLNQVIATAVAFGMPRRIAEEARTNPYVRTDICTLACLVWDAAAGDKTARNTLDRLRHALANRGDVAEAFAAYEQAPDADELRRLMGLD